MGVSSFGVERVDGNERPSKVRGVVTGSFVNVRSYPSKDGERIAVLRQGDPVMIQGVVNVSQPERNEDTELAEWYRIDLPNQVRVVWVAARFVDSETKRVTAPILNVRSGPGTYYGSVIQLEAGAEVVPVQREAEWLGIRGS